MISRRGRKSKIFLSVVIPVVKAAFVPFSATGEKPLLPVLQGFAAFCHDLTRIPPRHSQSRRATNCATPGYFVILSGWSYSPKPPALPTALIPEKALHAVGTIPYKYTLFRTGSQCRVPAKYPWHKQRRKTGNIPTTHRKKRPMNGSTNRPAPAAAYK